MADEKLMFQVGIKKSPEFDKVKKEVEDLEKLCNKGVTINGGGISDSLSKSIMEVTTAIDDMKTAVGTGKPLTQLRKKAEKAQEAIDKLTASTKNFVNETGRAIGENAKVQEFVNNLGNIIRAVNQDLKALQNQNSFRGFSQQAQDAAASVNKAKIEIAKLDMLEKRMSDTATSAKKVGLDTTALDEAIQKIIRIKSELASIRDGGGYSSTGLTTSKYMATAPVQIDIMDAKNSMRDMSSKTAEIERLNRQAQLANMQLRRMQSGVGGVRDAINGSLPSINQFKKMLAGIGGIYVIRELVSDIIRVRGEMEQMETAVTSLIGSADKAGEVIQDLKDFSRQTPLTVKDLMNATQTMIGFGVEVEKIPRFIRALGDVSIGNSERFKALALAFSQMTAAGRLMGQDNLQFINAGFNPLMYIAEKTGKTMKELRDEMQRGAITTKMVEQAFIEATEAGGKFYRMSEKTSQTVAGQMNKLRDSIYKALDKYGADNEQMIMSGIHSIQVLVDNYEQVGRALMGMVVSYGTYRTAVILATAAENGHTVAMSIARLRILATQKAQALLNATMLSNPYVAAATALGLLAGTLYAASDGMSAAERAQKNYTDAIAEAEEQQRSYRQETESAIETANNDAETTDKRREALNLLISRYPSIIQKYIDEKGHLKDILALKKEIASFDGNVALEDLNKRTKRYRDAASIGQKLRTSGAGSLTPEEIQLYNDVKKEYFDSNSWSAKAMFSGVDLEVWAGKMAKDFGKKAQRQAAKNATERFQDTISEMTDAQLQTLQRTLQNAKGKKAVIVRGYKDLANVTLSEEDIKSLLTYTGGIISAKTGSVRGKTQIEADKKAAQAELDALSLAEANGKKGVELRKKILGYSKELEAYNASKNAKSEARDDNAARRHGESIEKLTGEKFKQALALERQQIDMVLSTRSAEIGAMEESTEKSLRQIELDKDKKLEAIKREYEDLKITRIENAKKLWDADDKKKGVNFYESEEYRKAASDSSYTEAEIENRIKKEKEVIATYIRGIRDVNDASIKAMFDYLKKYGSVEQMRLAIRREYDRKIAREDDVWKRKNLEKERDQAIDNVTAENLIKNANLASVFNEYGIVLASPLEDVLKQLKEYTKTDNFKSRSIQDQKTVYDTINGIERQLGAIGGVSFKEIGQNLYEYNNALIEYRTASEELSKAAEDSINAREAVESAERLLALAVTEEAKAAAKRAKETAEGNATAANQTYSEKKAIFDNAQNRLIEAQTEASESLRNFQSGIERVGKVANAVASGGLKQLWDSLGAKAQARIGEFVTGSHSYNNAIKLMTSLLGENGKGMDSLVEKIKEMTKGILETGDSISESNIGEKISKLFGSLFGDNASKLDQVQSKIGNAIGKILTNAKETGEETDDTIKKAGDAAIQAITQNSGSIWGLIVGLIFDLLDVLAEGIGGLVETILEKVGAAIEGILTNIGSGKFFEQVLSGVGGLVSGVIKGVGNLFSGGTAFGGSNVDEMEEEIAQLAVVNEQLAKSIDSLAKSISNKDNTNQQSEEAYKRALAAEKEWEENQRRAIDDRASEWSNSGHGFLGLGGKHSFNSYVNDRGQGWYGWKDFNRVLQQNGYNTHVQSAGDLWRLSPEMMKLLRDYAPAAWAELLNSDGESNPSELIDAYIERAGKIDELTSALNEKLTGYSWDAFKGSYVDLLKDLNSTNQDFANNLEDMLTNAILNSLVNEVYKDRISKLYKMIAEAASDESTGGTEFTESELAAIRNYNDELASDLVAMRDRLVRAGIIKETDKNSKSSMGSSIKGVSEQTAGLLSSYANSMRADLSVIREILGRYMPQLVSTSATYLASTTRGESGTGSQTDMGALLTENQLATGVNIIRDYIGPWAINAQNYYTDMLKQTTMGVQSMANIEMHAREIMMSNDLIAKHTAAIKESTAEVEQLFHSLKNGVWKVPVK